MKLFIKHINMIAVIAAVISALCIESDVAMRVCAISTLYLALYCLRWEIVRGAYKLVRFYVEAFKEAKAGGKR